MPFLKEADEEVRTVIVETKSGGEYTIPHVGKNMAEAVLSFMKHKSYEELSIHCMNTSRHYIPKNAVKRITILDLEGKTVDEWLC